MERKNEVKCLKSDKKADPNLRKNETEFIKCPYCGELYVFTLAKCPNCERSATEDYNKYWTRADQK